MNSAKKADVLTVIASVPETFSDFIQGVDEDRLAYRHGPAFPTAREVIAHVWASGPALDGLIRKIGIDGQKEIDMRPVLTPGSEPEVDGPTKTSAHLLEDFARVRRRTVDLLRGLSDQAWDEVITEPRLGEMGLTDLCELVSQHEIGHLSQLRNLLALAPIPTPLG